MLEHFELPVNSLENTVHVGLGVCIVLTRMGLRVQRKVWAEIFEILGIGQLSGQRFLATNSSFVGPHSSNVTQLKITDNSDINIIEQKHISLML